MFGTKTKPSVSYYVRWMTRPDLDGALRREEEDLGPGAWGEESFLRSLRERNCIGMVVERAGAAVGHMLYLLEDTHLEVLRFFVDARWRRQGAGAAMLEKLKGKLSGSKRAGLRFVVDERDDGLVLFLRSHGFRATALVRGDEEDGHDWYRMDFGTVPDVGDKNAGEGTGYGSDLPGVGGGDVRDDFWNDYDDGEGCEGCEGV